MLPATVILEKGKQGEKTPPTVVVLAKCWLGKVCLCVYL